MLVLGTNIDKSSHITHICKDYTQFFVYFLIGAKYNQPNENSLNNMQKNSTSYK